MSFPDDYMGDGVYVKINDANQLELKTGSHDHPDNIVYIEPEVWVSLLCYVKRSGWPMNRGEK